MNRFELERRLQARIAGLDQFCKELGIDHISTERRVAGW